MTDKSYKVYVHLFPNGKRYVGLTRTKTWERWCGGHGYKVQPLMWNAIQKYGWNNIEHFIVKDNITKEEAEALEIELIKKYKTTDRYYGYNISNGGFSNGKHSDETRKKMSVVRSGAGNPQYGKPLTEEHKAKIRETRKKLNYQPVNKQKILCVETGIIYESTAQATRETGISNSLIRRVCYGEKKSAGGFHWQYV